MPPTTCPNCGADVPRNAKACPECGADEKTGWSDDAHTSNLGLPDEEFNYEEFVKDELEGRALKPRNQKWIWWITGVILILLFAFLFLH